MIKEESNILIEEQGLRDGIQNLSTIISTEKKIEYVHSLVDAGIKRIQIASFVHPKLVPQMADAELVCAGVKKEEGVVYSGLVLNERGVDRAVEAGLDHLSCSISASDLHSQKNARKTLAEARKAFIEMVKKCKDNDIVVRGGIQCAFGCRYEGKIDPEHVMNMVKQHLDAGIDELALADSTGMGNPASVEFLMGRVMEEAKGIPVVLHLHNTESKGYANAVTATRVGVRIFDTAFGGLGGCPFIKNATGNIATEDTIKMFEEMGYSTGVDIEKVAQLSWEMQATLGEPLDGKIYKLIEKKQS